MAKSHQTGNSHAVHQKSAILQLGVKREISAIVESDPFLTSSLNTNSRSTHCFPGLRSKDVVKIEPTGHPLLWERADRTHVTTGQLLQISAQHAIAIALRRGKAGLREFDDEAVTETLRDENRPDMRTITVPNEIFVRLRTRFGQSTARRRWSK